MRSSVLTLLLLSLPAAAQHIRDPHASLVDIPAQQARLEADPSIASTLGGYSCLKRPALVAPQGRMEIPHHYLSGSNGPVNPAEAVATKPYNDLETRVASGVDQWLATGNEAEAQCALVQLDAWAQAKALLDYDPQDSPQAWYQAEWTLSSLGISDSVLVNDAKLDPSQQARVNAWLNKSAHRLLSFDKPNGNNHHYWRGLAATSIGIATKDDGLFRQGVAIYKEGIDEIDERGAFPQEMKRRENAIHYQGFALEPLVVIAELAAHQGVGLYGYAPHHRSLRDAVVFFGNAAADPALVQPYTSDAQTPTKPGDFAAEAFFVARFGPAGLPADIAASVTNVTWKAILGGNLLLFTKHKVDA